MCLTRDNVCIQNFIFGNQCRKSLLRSSRHVATHVVTSPHAAWPVATKRARPGARLSRLSRLVNRDTSQHISRQLTKTRDNSPENFRHVVSLYYRERLMTYMSCDVSRHGLCRDPAVYSTREIVRVNHVLSVSTTRRERTFRHNTFVSPCLVYTLCLTFVSTLILPCRSENIAISGRDRNRSSKGGLVVYETFHRADVSTLPTVPNAWRSNFPPPPVDSSSLNYCPLVLGCQITFGPCACWGGLGTSQPVFTLRTATSCVMVIGWLPYNSAGWYAPVRAWCWIVFSTIDYGCVCCYAHGRPRRTSDSVAYSSMFWHSSVPSCLG